MLLLSLFCPFLEFLLGVEIKREKRKSGITSMHTLESKQMQMTDKCAC